METGSKNIQTNYLHKDSSLDGNRIKQTHSVFNLRNDGLGILTTDQNKTKVLAIADYSWDPEIGEDAKIREIERILLKSEFNFDDGLSLSWYISENRISLVPLELFEEGKEQSFLQNTSRFKDGDVYKSEIWQKHHIVCCYSLSKKIDDWLNFNFPQSQKFHHAKALIDLFNHYPQYGIYCHLHIESTYAELIICSDGRLALYNQFDYKVPEDLLYFLLFAFEQSRILAPEVDVHISGKTRTNDKLHSLLENYIGNVLEVKTPKTVSLSPQIRNAQVSQVFSLLGGL